MLRLGCLLVLVLLIAIPAVAAQYLPWWGTVLVVIGEFALLAFGGPKLVGYAFKRFALGLFKTKSEVLRGATAAVHRVEATEKPVSSNADDDEEDDDEDEEDEDEDGEDADDASDDDDGPRHYVLVDFTLTPRPGRSKMQFYDPSEMMLVPYDAKVSMGSEDDPTDGDVNSGIVERVRVIDEAGGEDAVDGKINGTARLQIVFACPLTLTGRVKFRYYFESFGDLVLPAPPRRPEWSRDPFE